MSVKTASVFTCNLCTYTEVGLEGTYEVPFGWFTVAMSKNISINAAQDVHVCESCTYTSLRDIWESI